MNLSDEALRHLRRVVDEPSLEGTPYELVGLLGRGGMGSVWEVRDERLDRTVALKVLDEPRVASAAGETLSIARIADEARTIARLEHPGIVPVHDVGQLGDGRSYYAMKLVRGERLDRHVAGRVELAERLLVFLRIAETVAFAHAQGVVHRDLKPANVMVGAFGEVLVLDWGIAFRHRAPEAEGSVVGTPQYMAPEQARGELAAIDARADVHALGRMLAELFVGAVPRASRPLRAIAARAAAERSLDRYADASELVLDLRRHQAGQPVLALRESVLDRLARFHRRYAAAIWLIAAYLVMRVLLILFGPR